MLNYGKSMSISGTKSVGSKVTPAADRHAGKVASGANRNHKAPVIDPEKRMTRRQVVTRGSSAGLKNQKTVRLTGNNTGYLNKANQNARNNPKTVNIPNYKKQSDIIRQVPKMNHTANDTRLTASNKSSISRINNKINRG